MIFLTLIPAFISEAYFNVRDYRTSATLSIERRLQDYLNQIGTSPAAAKEIRLLNLAPFLSQRFKAISDKIYRKTLDVSLGRALWGSVFASFSHVAYYFSYLIVIWETVSGRLSVGDLTFLSGSLMMIRGLLEKVLFNIAQMFDESQYLGDLFSILDARPQLEQQRGARPFPRPILQGFRFEDVGFKYKGSDIWAVRNINLTLRAGEVTAFVGQNGSGKSTLIKLLLRLYEPVEGQIVLDNVPLNEYDIGSIWQNCGTLLQDFMRYNFNAHENIAVGNVHLMYDRDGVVAVASEHNVDPIIRKLPGAYDQMLGTLFGSGVDLSGGEWQKIAIARANARQPKFLILDEPTAALDPLSEYEAFSRLEKLSIGKTVILISHRAIVSRIANRIVVLERARLLKAAHRMS